LSVAGISEGSPAVFGVGAGFGVWATRAAAKAKLPRTAAARSWRNEIIASSSFEVKRILKKRRRF
jgi:hypothetical protein